MNIYDNNNIDSNKCSLVSMVWIDRGIILTLIHYLVKYYKHLVNKIIIINNPEYRSFLSILFPNLFFNKYKEDNSNNFYFNIRQIIKKQDIIIDYLVNYNDNVNTKKISLIPWYDMNDPIIVYKYSNNNFSINKIKSFIGIFSQKRRCLYNGKLWDSIVEHKIMLKYTYLNTNITINYLLTLVNKFLKGNYMVKKEEPKIYYLPNPPNPINSFQLFNSNDTKTDDNTNKKNADKDCNKDKPINEAAQCEFIRSHLTNNGIKITIECEKLIQLLLSRINNISSLISNLNNVNIKLKIIINSANKNKYIKLKGGNNHEISKHEKYIPNINKEDLVKTQFIIGKIIKELQTEKYLNSLQREQELLKGGADISSPKTCNDINNIEITKYIKENMANEEIKQNYKKLALILHPDRYKEADMKECSNKKFIELSDIYSRIANRDKEIKVLTDKIDELNRRNNLSFEDFLREINIIEMFYFDGQDCTFLLNGTPMSNLIKESTELMAEEYFTKITTCDMKKVSEADKEKEHMRDEKKEKEEVERLKALLDAFKNKIAAVNKIEQMKL